MFVPFAEDKMVGTLLAGRYRITGIIASGGAGHVFKGVQEKLGREVAIKVLRSDISDTAREEFESRFLREAALAGRLHSPYVVTVHDFGTDEDSGTHFVIMEYLDGRTLKQAMKAGPMEPGWAVHITQGIARGLRHAHNNGLIHRDVKPGNVLLVADDEGVDVPKLVDFGLVKGIDDVGQEVTTTGMYMGTPAYMPPEQARGEKDITGKADVYSLGCVFYRMLTGVLPFSSDNAVTTALMHIQDAYPPMSGRAPDVSVDPALEDIVRACMEKDPKARPDSTQLVNLLKEYAHGGPVTETAEISTINPSERESLLGLEADPLPDRAESASPPPKSGRLVLIAGIFAGSGAAALLCGGIAALGLSFSNPTTQPELTIADVTPLPIHDVAAVVEPALPGDPTEVLDPTPPADPAPEPKPEPEPKAKEPPQPPKAPPIKKKKKVVKKAAPPPPPPPPPPEPVTADGVRFDGEHAARAVKFLNESDVTTMKAKGMSTRAANLVVANRPFADMSAFAGTYQVGPGTVQSVFNATK